MAAENFFSRLTLAHFPMLPIIPRAKMHGLRGYED